VVTSGIAVGGVCGESPVRENVKRKESQNGPR
jgi:hypothetical protein